MTAERWRRIEQLFAEAVELSPDERKGFLDAACGGDEALRRELDSLLACDTPEQELIAPAGPAAAPDLTGSRLGPYRLIRRIGLGGMGAVYLGQRDDDQYRKQVAVKLLKRGMDTELMLGRFRQERQILAGLEHPFIARLLDGGASDDGLPYFVMEYVDGIPITEFCEERKATVPERLRLFRMVCEAVQHAHQNLVVHRDLKPSNLLVAREGVPKLLDFGIAKMLDPVAAEGITLTRNEARMMTPDYASPEQVKGLPVGTAGDIYSLGAVLYELLTGKRPHRFASASLADLEKTVCEVDPERPSLAVARNQEMAPQEAKQTARRLAGDLDNIVLTAMQKEPHRRYASVAEFSDDIRRHLEGLPVRARESGWAYRTGKFIRRHRLGVLAAGLAAASMTAGLITATVQARRAERRFQLVRGLANQMLFDLHDQMQRLPGTTALRASTIGTVVQYLDALAQDGSQDPGLEYEMAKAYERAGTLEGHPFRSNLGRGPAALSNYRKALALFERLAGRGGAGSEVIGGLIDAHLNVSGMQALLGNPAEAALHLERASSIASEAIARGNPEIPFYTRYHVYFRLADLEYDRGDAAHELANYRKSLETCKAWVAAEHSVESMGYLREAHKNAGSALARSGDLYGARESFRTAQQVSDELLRRPDVTPEQQYGAINVSTSIGDLLGAPDDPNFGDRAGALAEYGKALALSEKLAASDPRNVNARRHLGAAYHRMGMIQEEDHPAQALEYFGKALAIAEELGAGDPQNNEYRYQASRAHLGMGGALHHLGRHREAARSLSRSVELQKAMLAVSPERIWNLRVLSRTHTAMGRTLLAAGDAEGGLASLNEALGVAERMLKRAPSSLYHQLDRAEVLEALGRHYTTLARRPGISAERGAAWKAEAGAAYRKSAAIWEEWVTRGVASPYAERRLARVSRAER